jgi:hypothetical protein
MHSFVAEKEAGEVPTGFIGYEMPYYLANAREHFDSGFGLTYRNPYDSADAPRIYFQPYTCFWA